MPTPRVQNLSGVWRAAATDPDGAAVPAIDGAPSGPLVDPSDVEHLALEYDDSGWTELPVPGHWRSHPDFAESDGPILYRRRFTIDSLPSGPEDRVFLVLRGVMAAGDVWFDGVYLGDTRGYAVPHTFEVTGLIGDRLDHVVVVEAGFEPVGTGRVRDLSGSFGRSALLGTGHNPGGIWRDVELRTTGPVRIDHWRLRCAEATAERALLAVRVVLDAESATPVTIRTWVRRADEQLSLLGPADAAPLVIEQEHALAAGENRTEYEVTVPDPELWWPRALGEQPLYDVGVEILIDARVSDSHVWRTGLRTVELDDFIATVNGERLFLKGISVGPTRLAIADATPDEVAADIRLAAEAGLDLVRVHGHLARPELYDEADRLGILLWQDLPIQWALLRMAKPAARRVARSMVDQLAHHPSVFVWNAHHEPWAGEPAAWRSGGTAERNAMRTRMITAQVLPSWNRTLLDRSVSQTIADSDRTRPVLASSGAWPHLPQLSGSASHLWTGWRWGRTGDLARLLRWWPRLGRFVAEFGSQAPPDTTLLEHPSLPDAAWPDLPWPEISERTALELPAMTEQVPPDAFGSAQEWVEAMQGHQAELVANHVETLRRLKYRPTGGFSAFALADPVPGITAALLDHDRRPKPAWKAFVAACAPVIAVLESPPLSLATDDLLRLELHVVNDLRRGLAGLSTTVSMAWSDDPDDVLQRAGWTGEIGPDAVARVGAIRFRVPTPRTADDHLILTVRLTGPDGIAHERVHRRHVHR